MKPIKFAEQNLTVAKPPGMTEEQCCDLPACRPGNGQTISCWGMTWRERAKVLLTGRVWHGQCAERSIPPVWLSVDKPFVKNRKGRA